VNVLNAVQLRTLQGGLARQRRILLLRRDQLIEWRKAVKRRERRVHMPSLHALAFASRLTQQLHGGIAVSELRRPTMASDESPVRLANGTTATRCTSTVGAANVLQAAHAPVTSTATIGTAAHRMATRRDPAIDVVDVRGAVPA
jgi:hypothetical protein